MPTWLRLQTGSAADVTWGAGVGGQNMSYTFCVVAEPTR